MAISSGAMLALGIWKGTKRCVLTDDVDGVDVIQRKGERIAGGRIARLDDLVTAIGSEAEWNDDVLRSAPHEHDPLGVHDRVLQRIVLCRRQVRHAGSLSCAHDCARLVSTRVARSISAISIHSAAACAREMSPGP